MISTFEQLTMEGAATVQGHALRVGTERKCMAHSVACQAVGVLHPSGGGITMGME